MKVSVSINKVTVEFNLTEGAISKSGKSLILFSTQGFVKVDGRPGESLSIN